MAQTTWNEEDRIEEDGTNKRFPLIPFIIGMIGIISIIVIAILSSISSITTITTIKNVELETYGNLTVSQIKIIEMSSGHKLQQSGEEVLAALACLGANGSSKAFKTYGFMDENNNYIPTNVWLCMSSDGDWYGVVTTIFQKLGENQVARLITAYKIGVHLFPTIDDYTNYLFSRWGATTANFTIAAEKIFIRPLK